MQLVACKVTLIAPVLHISTRVKWQLTDIRLQLFSSFLTRDPVLTYVSRSPTLDSLSDDI